MISREIADQAGKLVEQALRERFQDTLVFDPIVVEPAIDHCGDEYLDIFVVYEGPYEALDPDWTVEMDRWLWDELADMGLTMVRVPSHSFVTKNEWAKVFRGKHPKAYEPGGPD